MLLNSCSILINLVAQILLNNIIKIFLVSHPMLQILTWAKDHFLAAPTLTSIVIYLIYYAYICIATLVIPAKIVNGHPNPKRGPQLKYPINGFKLTCLTIVILLAFGGIIPQLGKFRLFSISILVDQFWPLLSTVNLVSLIVSALLYLKGKIGKSYFGQFVDKHTHGSFGLDFWVGKQINPRLGNFDIKFCAYKVGMIWWLVLNFGFLAKQIQLEGTLTNRMLCYQFTTAFYIMDYFWNEEKMLTTWDIISEQFGLMLVFGDYVFIPFAFCVQCHYIIGYPDFSSSIQALLIIVLYFIGFYIFRTANSQKNQYKTDPTKPIWGKKPQTIGGKLLISGFWAFGRHMNYTGDLIMAIAYCLPCGAQLGGYFYAFYLFTLLLHRAYRDDTKCRSKYGNLWKQYCQKVPHVYLPFSPIDSVLTAIGRTLYNLTNKQDLEKHKQK